MKPSDFYSGRIASLSEEIYQLNRHNRLIVVLELLSACLAAASVVGYAMQGRFVLLLLTVLMAALYIAIRWKDSCNGRLSAQKERIRDVYRKEQAYLDGDFTVFPSGEQYVDPQHPFTFDLDIFGPQSLFHRINRTVTSGGSDFLANELAETTLRTIGEIESRREAIRELADREDVRTRSLAASRQHPIHTAHILQALRDVRQTHIPRFPLSPLSLVAACCSIAVFYGLIALSLLGRVTPNSPMLWAVLQCMLVYLFCSRPLRDMSKVVRQIHEQLCTYIDLIMQIADSGLTSTENRDIIRQLSDGQTDAAQSFRQLQGILNNLNMRSDLWVLISNSLFCGDYFLVRNYLRWQDRYMMHIEAWIDAVSHFDALVSMATFRYNEPEATDAVFVDADEVVFEAHGIRHPFLGREAVPNDFSISDRHYYIVTGANMAGKSTFLRSIGINYVLACCGMPVYADRLRLSLFSLFSSMRTTDDLAHGISYFNAELLRLQQLIAACRKNRHTLIILDEILKGTNSLDKLNGSRLFLEYVSRLPVTGIIATHDLALSEMQQEHPACFHRSTSGRLLCKNYCFEIQLSNEITYTYKIAPGVARNQNATFLLKEMLGDIEAPL